MAKIIQYSIDVNEFDDAGVGVDGEKIAKVLEDAGIYVMGIDWKATWTEEGYHKSESPIYSD